MSISLNLRETNKLSAKLGSLISSGTDSESYKKESKFRDSNKLMTFAKNKKNIFYSLQLIIIFQLMCSISNLVYNSSGDESAYNEKASQNNQYLSYYKSAIFIGFLSLFSISNYLMWKYMKSSYIYRNDIIGSLLFMVYCIMCIEFQNVGEAMDSHCISCKISKIGILKSYGIIITFYLYHQFIINSPLALFTVSSSITYIILRIQQPINFPISIIESLSPILIAMIFRMKLKMNEETSLNFKEKQEFRRYRYFFKNSSIGLLEIFNSQMKGHYNHSFQYLFGGDKKVKNNCAIENFLTLESVEREDSNIKNDPKSIHNLVNNTFEKLYDTDCLRTISRLKTKLLVNISEKSKVIDEIKSDVQSIFTKKLSKDIQFVKRTKNYLNHEEFYSSHKYLVDSIKSIWSTLEEISVYSGLSDENEKSNKNLKFSFDIPVKIEFLSLYKNKTLLKILITPYFIESSPRLKFEVIDKSDKMKIHDLMLHEDSQKKIVSSVSHELRQPLNGIVSMMELLELSVNEDLRHKFVKPVINSAKLLIYLVNDILDASQMKEGKLRIVNNKFKLIEILEEVCTLIEIQTKNRGIKLLREFPENIKKVKITSDQVRLRQIVLNLLSNALKFTYFGSITLKVDREDDIFKISVIDTGCGIKEEDKNKLFQRFGKLDMGENNFLNAGGVGLGLQISHALAKRLGPDDNCGIELESEFNKGSKFSFKVYDHSKELNYSENLSEEGSYENFNIEERKKFKEKIFKYKTIKHIEELKLKGSTSSNVQNIQGFKKIKNLNTKLNSSQAFEKIKIPSMNSLKIGNCDCRRILIVDDNEMNIIVMQRLFENMGMQVDKASSGEEALTLILRKSKSHCCSKYILVFMDANLPLKSGSETTVEIKKLAKDGVIEDCIVIGCTADSSVGMKNALMEAGMSDVLYKPVTIRILNDIIEQYMFESKRNM